MIRFWLNQIEYCVIWIAKKCSRAGASNYIPHILLDVITCPCHWYLPLVQHSSYMLRWWQWPCLFSGALSLQWRHNERNGVSTHRCLDCFLNRLFRRRSKEPSKLHVTGLCAENTPVNSPHKGPVTRKMFLFDDVIMDTRANHSKGSKAQYTEP